MKIGNVEIKGKLALAPMAGVADRAFRELCVEFGAAYVVGEMASAKGISLNDKKSSDLLSLSPEERPAAVQIFGDDPEIMAQAVVKALAFTPQAIDINMGCPAPKISNNGGGASLMRKPYLAQEIVKACVKVSTVPITVKLRSGWDENNLNALELALLSQEAGASAVTLHGRTRVQMYAPPVNYDIIGQVKNALRIPVIGNGEVIDGESAKKMFDLTGCDLAMVGRGALGRPWIFGQIEAYLKDGTILPEPDIGEKMSVMLRHVANICKYKGNFIGIREARKHAAWYLKGIRGAAAYRQESSSISSLKELGLLAEKVVENAKNQP